MKKKYLFSIVALSTMISSCSSDINDFPESFSEAKGTVLKSSNVGETIITDKGEIIFLSDTTVYTLDDLFTESSSVESWSLGTRSVDSQYPMKIEVKGFDTKKNVSSYVKVQIGKEEANKYGLVRGNIYLICNCNVTKELSQKTNESINPRNYTNNLDDTPMGWSPGTYNSVGSLIKGFDVSSNSVANYVTATTMLKYINCDLSGKSINRYIPYEPSDLIWQYVLNYSENWD